ncbi:MAG TPA: hypothetical protein V6D08_20730 [Candidatus Obscuribacterales bacterium]
MVYLLVATFPGGFQPLRPDLLDPAWRCALNYLANSGHVFGRDVVFTLGPLGYLLYAGHWGSNLIHAIGFMLLMHLSWAVVLLAYVKATTDKTQFCLFALGYALTYAFGLPYEYHLLSILLLLCYLPGKLDRPKTLAGIAAGAAAAFFMVVKFNLGCSALLAVTVSTVCWRLKFGRQANRFCMATCLSYMVTFAAFSAVYFKSIGNLWAWVRGSIETAVAHSETMSLVDHSIVPVLGLSLLCALLAATAVLVWQRTEVGLLAVTAIGSIFIAFKHSFIRQDQHVIQFFLFSMAVISMIGLSCRRPKAAYACFWCFVIVSMVSLQPLASRDVPLQAVANNLDAVSGLNNIRNLLDLRALMSDLDRRTQENFSQYKLPPDLIDRVRKAGNPPVGTLPNCVGYCLANNLRWDPLPLIQLDTAYTPYLDKLCADHFNGPSKPEFVIYGSTTDLMFDFGEIDHRNPILEAPHTAVALLRNYELAAAYRNPDVLLLQRRRAPQPISQENMFSKRYNLNEWIPVPQSSCPLAGRIKLHPKPLRYLVAKLYQLPPIEMQVASRDGFRTYRMLPTTLSSGPLLNCFPRDFQELGFLLDGVNPNPVQFIRFTGPGCPTFKRSFDITWMKLSTIPLQSRSQKPGGQLAQACSGPSR